MAEKLKQVLGFFGKNPERYKGKVVEKVTMGGSYATMVRKSPTGNPNVVAIKDLEEARRVVSSGSCAWEGTQVRLEHWSPRDEVDRQSREVRGEEDPRAGQRVMKGWGAGGSRCCTRQTMGRCCRGPNRGPKGNKKGGWPSLLFGSMDLKNKGVGWSEHSHSPEAEFFAARENEDIRKLQEGVRLTVTDRAA
ncbi:hypothetical protein CK203_095301 [Vitis vinifera]|uniref:Uncharacterized protein n=1 Tax=Vitis vinifera TaxID=29760 RepID=A0A438D8D7_VITVI|nr:hypothetical protein CK203_095301 [Vitis vinifera]